LSQASCGTIAESLLLQQEQIIQGQSSVVNGSSQLRSFYISGGEATDNWQITSEDGEEFSFASG